MKSRPPFVLASNRGPVSFSLVDGELQARRGAGGLVSGLAPIVAGTDTLWIAAAMTDGDRQAAAGGVSDVEGFRTYLVDVDPGTFRSSYDVVCNQILWFIHHGLFDRARTPRFDRTTRSAWTSYRLVNIAFADAIASHAPEGATVLVQDYHLALVGPQLRRVRPDLRTVHFSHTPFATPDEFAMLPAELGRELLEGMAGHDVCAFHSDRWRRAFIASCERVLGEAPPTVVSPLASDPDDLRSVARGTACEQALQSLEEQVGDRQVIARVDRIELSKNILRGFEAYDLLLSERPDLHDRVVFVASVYPSRQALASYQAYRQEVETRVRLVNERHGTETWTPILLDTRDDFPSSVAVLRRSDVLLVNAVRDGLNLVAKEGALVNERDGVLLLSPECGIHDELADMSIEVPPFDLVGTAEAMAEALGLGPAERQSRANALRERSVSRTPSDWLDEQLGAVGVDPGDETLAPPDEVGGAR